MIGICIIIRNKLIAEKIDHFNLAPKCLKSYELV